MDTKAWRASYRRIVPKIGWKQILKRTRSASKFELLPNELLIPILEYVYLLRKNWLGHPDQGCLGTRDLLSVMRCCRRLNQAGETVLWSRIVHKRTLWESRSQLPDLVRIALERPDLVKQVRSFELNDYSFVVAGTLGQLLDNSRTTPMLTSELLPPRFDRMLIQSSQWISFAALLLHLCQKLETLDINLCRKNHDARLWPLRDAWESRNWFDGQPKFLPKLRSLSISFDKCNRGSALSLLMFMQHPSLEVFNGTNMIGSDFLWEDIHDLDLPLKTLRLESSNINPICLGRLLTSCPRLESVMYDHSSRGGNEYTDPFQPQTFVRNLQHLKPNLKELILYRREQLHQAFRDVHVESLMPIGSLCDFPLVHLAITAHLLLGYQLSDGSTWSRHYKELLPDETHKLKDVLPKSLQKLRVMHCGSGIIQDAIDLIEQKETLVPELKSLTLEFQDLTHSNYMGSSVDKVVRRQKTHMMVNEKLLPDLERICVEKGVMLDIWYN